MIILKTQITNLIKKFNNTIINRLEERPETFAFTLESMKRGVFT